MTLLEELNSIKYLLNFKKILKDGAILKMYYDNKYYNQWLVECCDEYDNFYYCKGFNNYKEAKEYYNNEK